MVQLWDPIQSHSPTCSEEGVDEYSPQERKWSSNLEFKEANLWQVGDEGILIFTTIPMRSEESYSFP